MDRALACGAKGRAFKSLRARHFNTRADFGSSAPLGPPNASGEDVNFDGLLDLVCHIFTQETDFKAGDVAGTLTGQTVSGVAFTGTDSVRIVH